MRSEVMVIVFALLAFGMVATSEAQAHGPVQSILQAAPARKAVRATAHVAATAVRVIARVAAAPVRVVGHAAHRVVERRPVRRALRGAARVVAAPVRRIRFR
jgi:redox-regulated HSP33 family molecular chaperone